MKYMLYLYTSVEHDALHAGVAELADAHDSKSCSFWSAGSTPATGILRLLQYVEAFFCCVKISSKACENMIPADCINPLFQRY